MKQPQQLACRSTADYRMTFIGEGSRLEGEKIPAAYGVRKLVSRIVEEETSQMVLSGRIHVKESKQEQTRNHPAESFQHYRYRALKSRRKYS